ncbi:MAG: 30S ribosomal protein S6 [Deltaproteobacteria bacterium]|nr:30S ribosomal protein S6 [Deltaproteobacteria bacterium]
MRRYESVWVMNGDLPDEDVKATIDKFTKILAGQEGILVSVEEWGRRKLAYKVQGTARGFYVLVDYAGTPATVKELERNYRIDDRIIRSHTARKSDKVDLEALQAEIAARAQATATAATAAAAAAAAAAAPVAAAEAPAVEATPAPVEAAVAEAAAPQGKED